MTDTATPTPGNRLDAAIEAAKVAVNDLRQQLAAKAAEVGQEVNAKVDEIQAQIDEIQAARAEENTSQTQGTPEAPEPGVGAV